MKREICDKDWAALEVLRTTGVDVLEAALVAKEALECGRGRLKRARACVQLGKEQLKLREKTVSFVRAVETALEDRKRKGLRARSICGLSVSVQAADGAESGVGGAAGAEHYIG